MRRYAGMGVASFWSLRVETFQGLTSHGIELCVYTTTITNNLAFRKFISVFDLSDKLKRLKYLNELCCVRVLCFFLSRVLQLTTTLVQFSPYVGDPVQTLSPLLNRHHTM